MTMAKILVVDDSPSMRKMISFTLSNAGHKVVEASDGAQALALAKNEELGLVISDINMPKMDGIQLIKNLRQIPSLKFTPILMLTTETGDDKREEGKAAGASGWLVKPFNPQKLQDIINKVL